MTDILTQKNQQNRKTIKPRPAILVSEKTLVEHPLQLRRILLGLADESVPVILVSPKIAIAEQILSGSVTIINYPELNIPLMAHHNKKILIEKLEPLKPNLLHCLCPSLASITKKLARQLDLPYIININSLQKKWTKATICPQHCAKIIVPSDVVSNNVEQIYPNMSQRILRINPGTFVSDKCAGFDNTEQVISIITSHSLEQTDDFIVTLQALRRLADDGWEFILVVTGNGQGEKKFRKILREMDMLQKVVIVPRIEPWRPIASAGDIFIQHRENAEFNFFLLEAMAVGNAVIACKGGIDDLLIEGSTCLFFEPENPMSLYRAFTTLLTNKDRARQIAAEAQKFVKENYSVSKMASATMLAYHQIANGAC